MVTSEVTTGSGCQKGNGSEEPDGDHSSGYFLTANRKFDGFVRLSLGNEKPVDIGRFRQKRSIILVKRVAT
jgi:hypothetical protein